MTIVSSEIADRIQMKSLIDFVKLGSLVEERTRRAVVGGILDAVQVASIAPLVLKNQAAGSRRLTGSPAVYEYRFQVPGSFGPALAWYGSGVLNLP